MMEDKSVSGSSGNSEAGKRLLVGIDLGGTKTTIGVAFEDNPGEIVARVTLPTLKEDPSFAVHQMVESIHTLARKTHGKPVAVGIGAPGPLNRENGVLLDLPNLPAWKNFPINKALQDLAGVPVVLENDANVASLGELHFGVGRNYKDFIYITLGTGIGGALILDGSLYRGGFGGAGEIGHIQVDPDGPVCGCGRRGCVEALSAGPAIAKAYGEPSERVFALAALGDSKAQEVLKRAGAYLGKGLAQVVTLLDPRAIIFGGGMTSGDPVALSLYIESCCREVLSGTFAPGKEEIKFLVGSLGQDAGVLGAAWLAGERCRPAESYRKRVPKPWGEELIWALTRYYAGKVISVKAGHSLSLQYHVHKDETMYFLKGSGILELGDNAYQIRPGLSFRIPPGEVHRVIAHEDLEFVEVSTPELDDVVRLKDDYGRPVRS